MALTLEIVTPSERALTVQCDEVRLPGARGGFGVRPGHTPLVAELEERRKKLLAMKEGDPGYDRERAQVERAAARARVARS